MSRRIESCRAPGGRLSEPGPRGWFVWPWPCHRFGHVWVAGVYVAAADAGEERCAACGVAFWAAEDRVRGRELLPR